MLERVGSRQEQVEVRGIRLADLARVREIEREAFGERCYNTSTFLSFATRGRGGSFVAVRAGAIVGYVLTRRSSPLALRKRGGITSIAVDSQCRRQGVGAQLLSRAMEHLRRAGVVEMDLEVNRDNHRAIAFYQRAGFRADRMLPNYYGRGEHGLRMVFDVERR